MNSILHAQEQLEQDYEKLQLLAERITVGIAVNTMRKYHYDEFVIGMGVWFFCSGDNHYGAYDYKDRPSLLQMYDHIGEWNEALGLTGNPMRITPDGNIVRVW